MPGVVCCPSCGEKIPGYRAPEPRSIVSYIEFLKAESRYTEKSIAATARALRKFDRDYGLKNVKGPAPLRKWMRECRLSQSSRDVLLWQLSGYFQWEVSEWFRKSDPTEYRPKEIGVTTVENEDGTVTSLRQDGSVIFSGSKPFQPGHMANLKHGAHSSAIVKEKAIELQEHLLRELPMLVTRTDERVINGYAEIEARLLLLRTWFWEQMDNGTDPRQLTGILREIGTAERTSLDYMRDLALTPASRAKIAKDIGFAQHFDGERLRDLREGGIAILASRGISA